MSKNKRSDGASNICGKKVAELRKQMKPRVSQNGLSILLELEGLKFHKNAIQKIEDQTRSVNDIELKALAKVLHTTMDYLISDD